MITRTCPSCGHEYEERDTEEPAEFYSANITHNLHRMADEAGIGDHLWNPESIDITKARELIEPLRAGLALMESDPLRFQRLDADNGWGTYRDFVPWIRRYLAACESYPDATIEVSR